MTLMRAALLAFGLLSGLNCAVAARAQGIGATGALAIVDVTVLPMDADRIQSGQTVIVRDGLVAEIGPAAAVRVPSKALRIEGAGRYLLPGLTDAHVHLRDESELLSYLAHGVTTVVHLSGPSGNVANVYNLRARVAAGVLPGPRIYTSGPIIDGEPAIFPGVSTVVRSAEEATSEVRRQLEAGADLVKVYNNLRTEALRAVAAHASGAMVWGHIPRIEGRPTALERALESGLDVIAHGEELFFTALYSGVESRLDSGLAPSVKPEALMAVARLVKASGATVIPNLSFVAMTRTQLDSLAVVWSDPEIRYLHPAILQTWREQNPSRRPDLARFDLRERGKQGVVQQLTATLNDAGVPLLLGTDASAPGMFPGKSAHLELQLLVEAGLTPYEALASGTRNPGRVIRERGSSVESFGILREGSRADLLLVDQNPLADIANVARVVGVVVRGEWYSRQRIDSLRLRAAATFPR